MDVILIKIEDIDATNRKRPVKDSVAEQLAESIQARGQRQPVEVVAQIRGKKYRLISGGHRHRACEIAEIKTIFATVLSGTALQLHCDELLENFERNELSMLERAEGLAELKALFQEAHPEAKNGGDRTTEQFAKLANWTDTIVERFSFSGRTVDRCVAIGEKLSKEAADKIRGSAFEDNQGELEALSKLGPEDQLKIAKALTDESDTAPKTVAQAVKVVNGHAKPDDISPEDKQYMKLLDTWKRTGNLRAQRRFLKHLADEGLISIEGAE